MCEYIYIGRSVKNVKTLANPNDEFGGPKCGLVEC